MKQLYIFLFTGLTLMGLASCSTPYRSSTTPDDVYGTKGSAVDGYDDGIDHGSAAGSGNDYYSTPNENYVRMRVQDPQRWGYFDDYNYDYTASAYSGLGFGGPYIGSYGFSNFGYGFGYNPFFGSGFGYGFGGYGYFDNYYLWNSYYNPYYGGVLVTNGKNINSLPISRGADFNPAAYKGRASSAPRPAYANRLQNGNVTTTPNYSNSSRSFYNRTSTDGANYNQNNSNYNRANNYSRPSFNTQPVRSAPASNFSSGGGGGGGGMRAGGMSRPGR